MIAHLEACLVNLRKHDEEVRTKNNGKLTHVSPAIVSPTHVSPTHVSPTHVAPTHVSLTHVSPTHISRTHVSSAHVSRTHVSRTHVSRTHVLPTHVSPIHVPPTHVSPADTKVNCRTGGRSLKASIGRFREQSTSRAPRGWVTSRHFTNRQRTLRRSRSWISLRIRRSTMARRTRTPSCPLLLLPVWTTWCVLTLEPTAC